MSWKDDQNWEAKWWGTCQNTYLEEQKQLHYAIKMGLKLQWQSQGVFIDMEGKTVLDIGGGAVSLLLKCKNVDGCVIDPCVYPDWVYKRYESAKISHICMKAEDILRPSEPIDEVWIYNVLQHVENPELVVKKAREISKIIRVFDWLEIGVAPGHPWNLTEAEMNKWFGGQGKIEMSNGGKEYSGIFLGDHYEDSNLSS